MKILISPIDLAEAKIAWQCGTDIIDIKNISEGSLGASFPWIIRETIESIKDERVIFSATLGDLPYKPGTAALAAQGALSLGVRYIKAGLHGPRSVEEGADLMQAVARTCREFDDGVQVVAAGYADHRRFDGLPPDSIVDIGAEAGADVVMLDTLYKDGDSLFDAASAEALRDFVGHAHERGLKAALAGSVALEHLAPLAAMGTDIVGVRGAVCPKGDRASGIDADAARAFIAAARSVVTT